MEESKRNASSSNGGEHESRNHPASSTFTSPSRGPGLQPGMSIEQGGRLPVAFQASPSSVRNFPAPNMYPPLHQRERPQFWTACSKQSQHDFVPGGPPPLPFPSGIITSRTTIPPGIIPPGTELVLPDSTGQKRKFRMQYSFHFMSRLAAQNLQGSFSGIRTHTVGTAAAKPQEYPQFLNNAASSPYHLSMKPNR